MVPPVFEELNTIPSEAGLPRDVYALLAQANLLRMRGCWEDAVDRCMAALRLAPESSSAQSLMGDIYENQGRYDDAAQWYRMALDLNPNSPADRMKLDLLLRLRVEPAEARASASAVEAPAETEPSPLSLLLQSPEKALRFGAVAAALLLLFVVGLAYASTHRHGTLASLRLTPESEVHLKPVVVPGETTGVEPLTAALHDPAEQALLDELRGSTEISALGIVVTDVQSDPRTAHLTLSCQLSAALGVTRPQILKTSLFLLQRTAALPEAQSVSSITIRCLTQTGGADPGSMLLFVGDAPRTALPPLGTVLTDTEAQSVFSSPWWSPNMPN